MNLLFRWDFWRNNMSNWNESPDWNLLSTINDGKEFSAADGLLASDVVRIVENVVYVYFQDPKQSYKHF